MDVAMFSDALLGRRVETGGRINDRSQRRRPVDLSGGRLDQLVGPSDCLRNCGTFGRTIPAQDE